jgi:hypothetical protein
LRLKLAKQGCFRPRDALPKQSAASAGHRMAARSLGQRITGGPRCPRMHRATTTAPLSPPQCLQPGGEGRRERKEEGGRKQNGTGEEREREGEWLGGPRGSKSRGAIPHHQPCGRQGGVAAAIAGGDGGSKSAGWRTSLPPPLRAAWMGKRAREVRRAG